MNSILQRRRALMKMIEEGNMIPARTITILTSATNGATVKTSLQEVLPTDISGYIIIAKKPRSQWTNNMFLSAWVGGVSGTPSPGNPVRWSSRQFQGREFNATYDMTVIAGDQYYLVGLSPTDI